MDKAGALLERLKEYDTPSVTNVVATYPNSELCLGLCNPWKSSWYTDQSLRCMYPELGRTAGYAVTVTYSEPDAGFDRLGFADICRAIEDSPKPVVLIIKQNLPEELKRKNGLCGGNMMTAFKSLGVVGVISDGPSRDIDEVRPRGLQYMLTGVCAGHGEFSVQEINAPVEVCGMMVAPGDIVHMDENGAVRFPANKLEAVAELCEKLRVYEQEKQRLLAQHHDAETIARIMSDNYYK